MNEDKLRPLAVLLKIFPDTDSMPKVAVPALRQLILSATGKAASYSFEEDTKTLTFPDGVEIQEPHFHKPAAHA